MIVFPSKASIPPKSPFDENSMRNEISLDDDITQKLQSKQLPLEVQLMLVPMWTLRSEYHDSMRPLDTAMMDYMEFREKLVSIDLSIELGTATCEEVSTAFDQILSLFQVYEKNQRDLLNLMKQVGHQLAFYAHATKNDLMWNEMEKLREIDEASATRRICCFEHIVISLFKLDESIKDSLQTSQDIAKCCANYLTKITKVLNFKGKGKELHLEYLTNNNEIEAPKGVEEQSN